MSTREAKQGQYVKMLGKLSAAEVFMLSTPSGCLSLCWTIDTLQFKVAQLDFSRKYGQLKNSGLPLADLDLRERLPKTYCRLRRFWKPSCLRR